MSSKTIFEFCFTKSYLLSHNMVRAIMGHKTPFTPTPGIEPGYSEENTISSRTQYHCAMWAISLL